MLDHAGDINAQKPETGCTLLYIAAYKGNLEITTELITRGAKINTDVQDNLGKPH
jgi:ankyrin repeat protein